MGDTQAGYLEDELAKAQRELEVAKARISELEQDQETLFDDVERLNGCLTRAYEIRRSSQERLKSARAEIIRLRGQLRGDAPGEAAADNGEEA